ncbi:hypothetical protein P0082_08395 [Candidatus Haliotispira prima]|uniref:Lipoprotein n=1 Tax=Candidatus Haliotispira prima TaxID=3034016 RepID=A0ABY8MEW2_9SPIO|nr:hypothetical protein P0082_08395 [Candidatus Haliotispira prima]
MVLSACAPMTDTGSLPAAPNPDTGSPPVAPSPVKSVTVNYSGLHYVHFTANDPNLSEDKTVGFLITAADSRPSKPEAEAKKGYITRKFTETQKTRDIFMFLHGETAYELAAGSTDILFGTGAAASDTSFETSDILQENTSYKIRMYDGDTILEKAFTTKSFAAGDASSEGTIAYMGGLTAAIKGRVRDDFTEQEIRAFTSGVPLTIERKPEEIMLIPYADDIYTGNSVFYSENITIAGGCFPLCGTGFPGGSVYALRKEANKLVSTVSVFSPRRNITPAIWSAGEDIPANRMFDIEIISE